MHPMILKISVGASFCLVAALSAESAAHADDTASPCAALKRIVAAAPQHFAALGPDDGRAVAQPYGDDAHCATTHGTYQCEWNTRNANADSGGNPLEGVGADIAACLPDATHDLNSPGRQHFYLGTRASRTEITAQTEGATRVRLSVSQQ
ncbi:hypothetical protein [Paraburkholderia sp. J12]|uniref:hypothetical protein n=1 Tax=Paraburkholderia sp. J12 TaxID=2805432 RepID=UPI002ABDC6AF|nr:hypothetical protein [Paraburkholderia sp. J12]